MVALFVASVLAMPVRAAGAQDTAPGAEPVFTSRDALLAGGFVAAQLLLLPFDDDLRDGFDDLRAPTSDDASSLLRPLGRKPPWYVVSAATYLTGRLAGAPRLADLGLHAFASLTVAHAVTGGLKGFAGRARPLRLELQGADTTWVRQGAHDWRIFSGLTGGASRQSWPSGHATTAFTIAAVLSEEFGGAVPWVAYPLAAGVAWSRLNDEAHWATDVLMGAAIGTFVGRGVVRYGHRRGGWLERVLLVDVDPRSGGLRLGARLRHDGP